MTRKTGTISQSQEQTAAPFGYKWAKRDTFESEASLARQKAWPPEIYCEGRPEVRDEWFARGSKTILDDNHYYIGLDISDAVQIAEARFAEAGLGGIFHHTDLLDVQVPDGSVDIIFSEGALHHTVSVEQAILALSAKLRAGGKFLFYVYAKKSPLREYTNDYIREELAPMGKDEAWKMLEPLTRLGIALGELDITVDALEEIEAYCARAGLNADRMDIQESGMTVLATKA
jgi:SAM-dependent methyltransferase